MVRMLLLHLWWQPGDPGVLQGAILGFSEEARARGFASLTLVRFADLDEIIMTDGEKPSILECA